jgi:plasmid maintenance system antidote protein VapI
MCNYVNIISRISVNICAMQHRGEIIRKEVYNSGLTITEIAKSIGKSRKWMYLMFENSNVSLDLVLKIGKTIHYDFTADFKELSSSARIKSEVFVDSEEQEPNAEFWKNKYLKLLEEYNLLLKQR